MSSHIPVHWGLLSTGEVLRNVTTGASTPVLSVQRTNNITIKNNRIYDNGLPFSLAERSTSVTFDQIDQGITDVYYNTKFTLNYVYDYHPRTTTITVVSSDSEFYCADDCDLKVIDVDVAGQVCE